MTIKTVIVGLGKIGAENKSSKKVIRNHLNAVLENKNFEIKKLIDSDRNKIETVKRQYNFLSEEIFSNKYENIKREKVDLLVIATPHHNRSSQIRELLKNYSTKKILIEKPFAENIEEAKKIIQIFKKPLNGRIKVFINFIRRYSPGFNQIRNYLKEEKPLHINIRYNKGLINYGSHLIDFLIYWFGKVEYVKSYDLRKHNQNDLNVSFYCNMKKKIKVNFQFIDKVNYDQFEIDLFFKDKKISFRNGGVEKTKSHAIDSLYYSGYSHLGEEKNFKEQDFIGDFRILYEMIFNSFSVRNYQLPLCDLNEGFYNLKVINSIITSYENNKKIFIKYMMQKKNILQRIQLLYSELFPICRSLTGDGNVKSLKILKKITNFKIIKYKSGQKCFDWKVPQVWKIKDAYIKSNNKKIIDFRLNNINIINYSQPVKKTISFHSLKKKLHYIKNLPDAIPYRTTYYRKDWGFCISYKEFLKLNRQSEFEVMIDSKFENGYMHCGEFLKKGYIKKEFIFSTYFCHPSMANDNLSGMIAWILLLEYVKNLKTKYSYRFVIIPETIGSIAYLFNNQKKLDNVLGGFILTCISGPGSVGYKKTFLENHKLDEICIKVLKSKCKDVKIYPFDVFGSDERQYSSPNFRIPISTITKDKYFDYEYYHTSLDNLDFVKPEFLHKIFQIYLKVIEKIEETDPSEFAIKNLKAKEKEKTFKSVYKCEPMLSKRDLYPKIGGANFQKNIKNNKLLSKSIMWTLFFADGYTSIDQIIKKSKLPKADIINAIKILKKNKLIKEQDAK